MFTSTVITFIIRLKLRMQLLNILLKISTQNHGLNLPSIMVIPKTLDQCIKHRSFYGLALIKRPAIIRYNVCNKPFQVGFNREYFVMFESHAMNYPLNNRVF